MTKTSEFARALENARDELKEKGYADDDVILDCEGNEITQNEIVCSLLAEQVVEALEKQIPKRVTIRKIGFRLLDYICPCCTYKQISQCGGEWVAGQKYRYCSHCGQALDWGDTE
jgi:hypothetical protein